MKGAALICLTMLSIAVAAWWLIEAHREADERARCAREYQSVLSDPSSSYDCMLIAVDQYLAIKKLLEKD